ncbi:hypothetical protein EOD41_19650 [Mucilaginibacter limnophilus]|uniref:Uncharacterized protein n=1 Tax=Mucilaginibacter limnophilus TaxID=1932778 RepID=A0A3S2V5V0_9SPHI|nr:darcynin family protein [Mucilaginibacter limnophilus]RVT97220.1 hypothetical protein EOD41_19650 [Mucilaginibacter limnophilus]
MKQFILMGFLMLSLHSYAQKQQKIMEKKKPYTILLLMNATPQWLSLTREQRSDFLEDQLMPIFGKVAKTVNVKMFDSEYFHSKISDFLIVTTHELHDYKLMVEMLRDTKIYGVPYFQITDIIVGQENLFEDFNEELQRPKQ